MHRPSLLGHLVPLIRQPEPAATQALRYVLEAAPEIVAKFVEVLTGERFEIGRIGSEWQFENRVQPDLVIYDAHGKVRLFVENKFWAPLTPKQPVAYLQALPDDGQSMLAFIAPKDYIPSLWAELTERCRCADLSVAEETRAGASCRLRVGDRTLVLTNWGRVLDVLRHAAESGGHTAIVQDIDQFRGLTERMNSGVFLPLRGTEPTDLRVARRLLNYGSLIDAIIDSLVEAGVADTSGLAAAGWGRSVRVNGFGLFLCISLEAWRDYGITPLWCTTWESWSGGGAALRRVEGRFVGARLDDRGVLWTPIRLSTGVERERVVDDAVAQVRHLADRLRESSSGATSGRRHA